MKNCNCDNFNNRFLGLRDFCVQQFPFIAEDFDALTTYELLEKVICYLKKIGKYTEEMGQKFKDLLDYVNGYFDNLDVESVINQIIQNMYDEGLITEAIDNILLQTDEKCRKLVYVNCYGAKGDGITDDTQAIQKCLDENDNAIFIFYGNYKITDTIIIKFGTKHLLLSNMMWYGSQGKAMFKTESFNIGYRQGGIKFNGGCICGIVNNNVSNLSCGIWTDTFGTEIVNVRIADYEEYGILNAHTYNDWNNEDNKSTNLVISNCEIVNYPRTVGVGIAEVHTDNRIDNCNINGALYGVGYYGGNLFISNTHITPTVGAGETKIGYIIDFQPLTPAGKMVLSLDGCYLNGVPKYLIYNPFDCSHEIIMTGGAIIVSSNVLPEDKYNFFRYSDNIIYCYTRDVIIRCSPNIPYYNFSKFTLSNGGLNHKSSTIIPMYGINPIKTKFDCRNNANNNINSATPIITDNHPLGGKKKRLVGSIVFDGRSATTEIQLNRVNAAIVKYILNNEISSVLFSVGGTHLKLYIDTELQYTTINNREVRYKDIYLVNTSEDVAEYITTISGNSLYPYGQLYLYPVMSETDSNYENDTTIEPIGG